MALNFDTYKATMQQRLDAATDAKELLLLSKAIEATISNVAFQDIQASAETVDTLTAQAIAAQAAADGFQQLAEQYKTAAAASEATATSAATTTITASDTAVDAASRAETAATAAETYAALADPERSIDNEIFILAEVF